MLGYTQEDLDNMINGLGEVQLYIPPGKAADKLREHILMSKTFLEGLWAEGYFD